MSFESLTEAERKAVKRAQDESKLLQELVTDPNLETRKAAQRLIKTKRPDSRFPELEADDAVARASAASLEEVKNLRNELEQERAQRLKAEEIGRIRERGFDPEAVYKAMEERGIVNLDTALDMFDAAQQLGESSAGSIHKLKSAKPEIPKELVSENGHVNIEDLRSHLINQYVDESSGRRQNPLGFLHQ